MPDGDALPHSAAAQQAAADQNGSWRPYEGPMGGEGWENVETGEIRYQKDPPGETVVDADQQDRFNEENYTDDFLSAVQQEYGSFTLQFAEMACQPDLLLADPKEQFIRDLFYDEYGADWLRYESDNVNSDDGVAGEVAAAIAFAYDQYDDETAAKQVLQEHTETLRDIRFDEAGIPAVPLESTSGHAWVPDIPEYEEYYSARHDRELNAPIYERDAVLYEDGDGEMKAGKVDRWEGDGLYTLFDADDDVATHDQIKAWAPSVESDAIEVGGHRIGQGDWVEYERVKYDPIDDDMELRAGKVIEIDTKGDDMDSFTVAGENGFDEIHVDDSQYSTELTEVDGDGEYDIEWIEREAPEGFDDIEHNGMEMDHTEIASDIADRIDWDDTTTLGNTRAQGLTIDQKKRLKNELKRYFRDGHVGNYYEAISDWKSDATSGKSGEHAAAFKEALDIIAPARGWEEPTDHHVKIAKVMNELSQDFFEAQYGDSTTLYRGISGPAFDDLFDEWLEHPDTEDFPLEQQALNNYTVSWDTAQSFSTHTAVVEVPVQKDDIGLMTDQISSIGKMDGEEEIHVKGDDLWHSGELYAFGGDVLLSDDFDTWTSSEHKQFAERIEHIYINAITAEDRSLSEAKMNTLVDWANAVEENSRDLMANKDEIKELVHEIQRDAIVHHQYGLHADQAQLDDFKARDSPIDPIDLTHDADLNWMATAGEKPDPKTVSDEDWHEFVAWNRHRRQTLIQNGGRGGVRMKADAGEWEPYEGPQGGEGWRNTRTDEVRYTDEPPDQATTDPSDETNTVDVNGLTVERLDSPKQLVEGDEVLWQHRGDNHRATVVNTTSSGLTLEAGAAYPTVMYTDDDHDIVGRIIEDQGGEPDDGPWNETLADSDFESLADIPEGAAVQFESLMGDDTLTGQVAAHDEYGTVRPPKDGDGPWLVVDRHPEWGEDSEPEIISADRFEAVLDETPTRMMETREKLVNAFDRAENVTGAREAGISDGNTTGDEMQICEMPDGTRVFATPVSAYENTGSGLSIDPAEARKNNLLGPDALQYLGASTCQTAVTKHPHIGDEYIVKEGIEGSTLKEFKRQNMTQDMSAEEREHVMESLAEAGAAAFFVGNTDIHTANIIIEEDTHDAYIIDHDAAGPSSGGDWRGPMPLSTASWPLADERGYKKVRSITTEYMEGNLDAPPEEDVGDFHDYFIQAVEYAQDTFESELFDQYDSDPSTTLRGYRDMEDFEEGDVVTVVHRDTRRVKQAELTGLYNGVWYGETEDGYEVRFGRPSEVMEVEGHDAEEILDGGVDDFTDLRFGDRIEVETSDGVKKGTVRFVDDDGSRIEVEFENNRIRPVRDESDVVDVTRVNDS